MVPVILTVINEEEEEVSEQETTTDLVKLKRLRTTGKMVHTKAGNLLMQSVRISDDRETVRANRIVYVREYDNLEQRHDRYVNQNMPNLSANDVEGERSWIQAVIYDHQKVLAVCDDYLEQTKPKSVVSSRASSRRSSASSQQARIHDAERRQREA